MDSQTERIFEDAVRTGRRNAVTVEMARRHCLNMTFTECGGQGIAEAATGLPINMRQVGCLVAHGSASGNLDWIAGEFYEQHCVGCVHRRPTGDVPNLATVMDERREAAVRAEETERAETARRHHAWEQRAEHRRGTQASSDTAMAGALDDIGVLDQEPGTERDKAACDGALRRLTALAERAPETFTTEVIELALHPDDGAVRFDHDHYLKIWALTRPKIDADFLLLDEAQDTNPVVEQVFLGQREHAQLVMVGDSAQAIYQWRGAKDIMTGFDGTQLALSRSFRFGPLLAEEANRWLAIADAPLRLTGTTAVPTELGPVLRPDAVLCRTNAGAMVQAMDLMAGGQRVGLAGGGESLRALAVAARDLKEGRRTTHPELILFPSWGELQDYAAHDPAGRDLQPFVHLVDTHGTDAVLTAVARFAPEEHADVIVSTAHKAKGREWPRVKIADDFSPPQDSPAQDDTGRALPGPIDDAEARLAYVAVTRTRQRLDIGGLSWIRDHPDGNPLARHGGARAMDRAGMR
ncbi:hypothetical protein SGFS_001310 [Streptomyces graminofaciens]|uniref:DNA 3'-5' helicase n=1 Tax=Streptomyces graminofaciens TaxID=68212 RepID=A0ABM7EZL7_9ACTN|nr:UvrD-helicase domain-containing protein [Streptomyces graminofaciens]BBC28840.1 hypothetical protein SGFS_001310 [Streptomyces graminofaciens]